jgi:23S rRNA (cytidine1920-2'-O)/16S rRNA (cytidine1409-2'-O)-methyltransferase
LALVLPALGRLLQGERREALLLVKPQFEVGKERVGKGGVVRDPLAHADAIEGVMAAAALEGWWACGVVASPITGPAGNHEYLLWLRSGTWSAQSKAAEQPPTEEAIRRLVRATLGA